jgi:hypothetical protein
VWRLLESREDGPLLVSPSACTVWEGPVLAADRRPAVEGPASRSGVYAHATPAGLAPSLLRAGDAVVYGEVTLFGVVCVHEAGYRAERARIDRLFLRQCGVHPVRPARATRVTLGTREALELRLEVGEPPGVQIAGRTFVRAYCGCRGVAEPDWLSAASLEALANALGRRYGCDTVVDPVRSPPDGCCPGAVYRLTLLR